MDINLFDYEYPPELVAQEPLGERDASRLMVVDRKRGTWEHKSFRDFPDYFGSEDTLVFNDAKVFPARLYGTSERGRTMEILLLAAGPVAEQTFGQPRYMLGRAQRFASAGGGQARRARLRRATRCHQGYPCLVRPARKVRDGEEIRFSETLTGRLQKSDGDWAIEFDDAGQAWREIQALGLPPLPPYIKRERFILKGGGWHEQVSVWCGWHEQVSVWCGWPKELLGRVAMPRRGEPTPDQQLRGTGPAPGEPRYKRTRRSLDNDRERYQTIYAEKVGAAAAPTAGFHFTETILNQLRAKGCSLQYTTLYISRDTFEPVRVKDITEHRMHGEDYEIPSETAAHITNMKQEKPQITAIGTTTVRALESAYAQSPSPLMGEGCLSAGFVAEGGGVRPGPGHTQAFFYPGSTFNVVDRLLTNFHQPKSTLLMLVAAFAGRELILDVYREAIRQKYRLFSYGDAMLII